VLRHIIAQDYCWYDHLPSLSINIIQRIWFLIYPHTA